MLIAKKLGMNDNQSALQAIANERAKVTATIIDKIRRSQDLETIFTVTTQEMRRVLLCDRLIIYNKKKNFGAYWEHIKTKISAFGKNQKLT
jgi:light-regulated signal transduction histidine kinase (bacteriophytochrome)